MQDKIRNIGIVAHIDAGKTTLTEQILYLTGKTHKIGSVDSGTTNTDFDKEEQQRGITIYSAAVSCQWKNHTINIIDTPGHADFTAEVERCLRVLDGVIVVIDGSEGVEPQTEAIWKQIQKYSIPCLFFINKMDKIGADSEKTIHSLIAKLEVCPLPVNLPIDCASAFTGVYDLFNKIQELQESVANHSDLVLQRYSSGELVDPSLLKSEIRQFTLLREVCPVLYGSAAKSIGVEELLDAVNLFLPSPNDRNQELNKPNQPLAYIFKVIADKPTHLMYARVYSGTLKPQTRLLNSNTGQMENITQLYRPFAGRKELITEANAGDIVIIKGPSQSKTGQTLCDKNNPVILEEIKFPQTVVSIAVEPKFSKDKDKLKDCLDLLQLQDPTVEVEFNEETGQTVVSGMGELHLEIQIKSLLALFGLEVRVGSPKVSYKEKITKQAFGVANFEKKIGETPHFGYVTLCMYPHEAECQVVVPESLNKHKQIIENAIFDAATSGTECGYQVVQWKIEIDKAEFNSDIALQNACISAFYHAMLGASPVVLEPIGEVSIDLPTTYIGRVIQELNAKNSVDILINKTEQEAKINCKMSLTETFGLATTLRNVSQGRAIMSVLPSGYMDVNRAKNNQ